MNDSNFSSLIYRIIGKPERWHDGYIVEMMKQYLDQADCIDDPLNLAELEAGEQILSRLSQGNIAINAFNSLLNKSRFQIIILDENFRPLYHNQCAERLYRFIQQDGNQTLKAELVSEIQDLPSSQLSNHLNTVNALEFTDESGAHVYVRSIQSQITGLAQPTQFHILMALNQVDRDISLNPDMTNYYGLTQKEQCVIMRLVHGDQIKNIADSLYVSESTVRSHLKSIFRKTQVKSQAALISLVLTHESQVLDSYFDSDITTANRQENHEQDRFVVLESGHEIAYCDYGPKTGRPVIVFHSGFGSRLAIPANYQEICERLNRRVIIPDRPGLGKTAFIEGHPEQWNAQLCEFIDHLEIKQYDVLGSIIACQMAMSFAAQADHRLSRLILTSPVFLNDDSHTRFLTQILAPAAKYVKLSPQFAKEIYTLWLKAVTLNLDAHYPSMLAQSVGWAEREQFERDDVFGLLTNVFKEGARQSLDGILNEMVFCMTPLHLDLTKIRIPVDIWYGTEDKRITRRGVEEIFKPLPDARLHIRDGYSEHIYYSLFEEILGNID